MKTFEQEKAAALAKFEERFKKTLDAVVAKGYRPDDGLLELAKLWFVEGWILAKLDKPKKVEPVFH